MSIAIKTDNAIIQSESFNSLLNLMRQQQPQTYKLYRCS